MSKKVREWGVTSYSSRFKLIHIDSADQEDVLEGHVDYDDARLIADAPDFLETLKMCVVAMKSGMVDLNPYDEYVLQRAGSLIEKHEGDSDA